MAINLITMLGTGCYKEVTYTWADHSSIKTKFFPLAAATWLKPETAYVLVTEEVKKSNNYSELRDALCNICNVIPVDIPLGSNEMELWSQFEKILDHTHGEHIALDVTNGFRTTPMIALLSAAYLSAMSMSYIDYVLYGAYDARDKVTNVAPTFDLTPFLRILDWTRAATIFTQSGDSRKLGDLLQSFDRDAGCRVHGNELANLGKSLTALSAALATNRPNKVTEAAARVSKGLAKVPSDLPSRSAPFVRILDEIGKTYAGLENDDLEGTLHLIEWYVKRDRVLEAVTLAREWLVSLACERLSIRDREAAAKALNDATGLALSTPATEDSLASEPCSRINKRLTDTWSRVSNLRNDVNHCGYRKNPLLPQKVIDNANKIPRDLRGLLDEHRVQ